MHKRFCLFNSFLNESYFFKQTKMSCLFGKVFCLQSVICSAVSLKINSIAIRSISKFQFDHKFQEHQSQCEKIKETLVYCKKNNKKIN